MMMKNYFYKEIAPIALNKLRILEKDKNDYHLNKLKKICLDKSWHNVEKQRKNYYSFRRLHLYQEMIVVQGFMSIIYERCKYTNHYLDMIEDNCEKLALTLNDAMREPEKSFENKRIYALEAVEKVNKDMKNSMEIVEILKKMI